MELIVTPREELRTMVLECVGIGLSHHRPISSNAPVPTPDEPLTPDEVAALFKTSKVSIWNWEKKGLIRGYHLGNKKYFLRSELIAALTKRGGESA